MRSPDGNGGQANLETKFADPYLGEMLTKKKKKVPIFFFHEPKQLGHISSKSEVGDVGHSGWFDMEWLKR